MSEKSTVKENLVNKVYDYVLNMILTQEIKCGEKIPETMVAQKLDVSRTPIREALRRLANSGIIKIYPKRFAEVISFTEQDIKDLGFVRIMLDTMAAQLAIVNGSNADFSKLKEITDNCIALLSGGDRLGSIRLDCDFHLALSHIAGNPFLIGMQKDLYLKVELLLSTVSQTKEQRIASIEHHYNIIEKLYKRDSEEVIKLIYKHLTEFYMLDFEQYSSFHFSIDDIARLAK